MLTTILFDLDGTLLPMKQERFVQSYLKALSTALAPHGYDPEALTAALWKGTAAMVQNDGSRTNEEVFWEVFQALCKPDARKDQPLFDAFYRQEFHALAADCFQTRQSRDLIDVLQAAGYRLVLATNPIFPAAATESRMSWVGLRPEDFLYCSTYENSHYCKPNPLYYQEILDKLGLTAQECLMVGNDVEEDMPAQGLGMKTFLLTDCLINRTGRDVHQFQHGGLIDLYAYLDRLSLSQG